MKLDGIAMITRVVVWQKGYFRHKQRNTSCIVIVDLKSHTKRRRAKNLLFAGDSVMAEFRILSLISSGYKFIFLQKLLLIFYRSLLRSRKDKKLGE